jgi:predicted nucleic acid-binding protein
LKTSEKPARLVVDANPILSALLGGSAKRIFFESGINEFAVATVVVAEVRKYIPPLAAKTSVTERALEFLLGLLPLTMYSAPTYRHVIPRAQRLIAHRDPDDVDVLALALQLDIPIWTNDKDFDDVRLPLYTTAQLMHLFFPRHL